MKTKYIIATCEGDNLRDLDDNVNRVLKGGVQMEVINVSVSSYVVDGKVTFIATILQKYEN